MCFRAYLRSVLKCLELVVLVCVEIVCANLSKPLCCNGVTIDLLNFVHTLGPCEEVVKVFMGSSGCMC